MNLTLQVDPFSISGKGRFFTVHVDKDTGNIVQIVLTQGGVQGKIIGSVIDYDNKPARAPEHYFIAYAEETKRDFQAMQKKMIEKGYLSKDALLE